MRKILFIGRNFSTIVEDITGNKKCFLIDSLCYHHSRNDANMTLDVMRVENCTSDLGSSMNQTYPGGRKIHLSLDPNPSHLEAVNPVVVGKSRAKKYYRHKEEDIRNVVPILFHEDAAFARQGVVYETMQLAGVPDFNIGGTICDCQ